MRDSTIWNHVPTVAYHSVLQLNNQTGSQNILLFFFFKTQKTSTPALKKKSYV